MQAVSQDDPLVGTVLAGKYRIRDVLARGGMGRIYRAEQTPLGRIVAIKVLSVRFEAEEDPGFSDRFFLEASTLARLKHPNTVTVFDYGHEGDDLAVGVGRRAEVELGHDAGILRE